MREPELVVQKVVNIAYRYLFPLFVYSLVETEITIDLLTRVIISNWGPVISIE